MALCCLRCCVLHHPIHPLENILDIKDVQLEEEDEEEEDGDSEPEVDVKANIPTQQQAVEIKSAVGILGSKQCTEGGGNVDRPHVRKRTTFRVCHVMPQHTCQSLSVGSICVCVCFLLCDDNIHVGFCVSVYI